jgi:2-iminobutanoate/2-iminopropanoate deaminase
MRKQALSGGLPAPVGPLSRAVRVGDMLFIAGTVGVGPDGAVVPGGVGAQTRQTLENIRALVESAGGRLDDVVSATVFLANADDYRAMNEVYAGFFAAPAPARSTVCATMVHSEYLVEIDAIAVLGASG